MIKEKISWTGHIGRIKQWAQNDPAQAAALRNVLCFFFLMFAMGMIARGTAGASMPVVTAVSPYNGYASHSFSLAGSITGSEEKPFLLPEGLMVEQVYVAVGDSISEGDMIAAFLPDSVTDAVNLQQARLNQLRAQYERLLTEETADDFTLRQMQEQLDQARQNHDVLQQAFQADLAQAQQRCDAAAGKLNDIQSRRPDNSQQNDLQPGNVLPDDRQQDDRQPGDPQPDNPQPDDGQQDDAWQQDNAWQQEYAQAQAEWEQAQEQLQALQEQSELQQKAAAAQLGAAQSAYETARHQYEAEAARLTASYKENKQSAAILLVQIGQQERTLESLLQIRQQGDCYISPLGGTLVQCALFAGQPSAQTGGVIAQRGDAVRLTAPLTEQQALAIHPGDTVTVRQGQLQQQTAVTAVRTEQNGAAPGPAPELEIALPSPDWQFGAVWVDCSIQSEASGLCVPLDAVNLDGQGYFVYLIEEKNTVLGIENILVRLPVTVTAWGDAAVQITGALDSNSKIAIESTKPLSVGARVRIRE